MPVTAVKKKNESIPQFPIRLDSDTRKILKKVKDNENIGSMNKAIIFLIHNYPKSIDLNIKNRNEITKLENKLLKANSIIHDAKNSIGKILKYRK